MNRQPFIRTVLGDIPASELGVCYAHEHIILDRSYPTTLFPDLALDSVDHAVGDLKDFYKAGGRCMVDSMPCDAGRNVWKLVEVSRTTGVHILCPTGLHLGKYYPEGHWGNRLTAEELAELFIADIEQGIDSNDYGGPDLHRTRHRAGLIKIASGLNDISDHQRKVFEAAAITHGTTGAPILTHTEQGTAAEKQVELLQALGVDLNHVVLSHTDRKPDLEYHKAILASGVNVELDSAFRWNESQGNPTLDLLVKLREADLINQVMLGMDAARRSYWKSYGGNPGMAYLLETFWPQMVERGFRDEDFESIFVMNPCRAFAVCI